MDIQLIILVMALIVLVIYVMIMIGLMASKTQSYKYISDDVGEMRTAVNTKYKIA